MTSTVELIATLLALIYVVLAIRESRACFAFGFISALLYLWIFWQVRLYMEAGLQIFYAAISLYGWWHWGGNRETLPVSTWTLRQHALAWLGVGVGTALAGGLLAAYTDAALPWVDSFTTVAALLTSWMVARKVLENWLYWMVIDITAAAMYVDRQLWVTAGLYGLYTLLAVAGYLKWRRHWGDQSQAAA